MRKTVLTLALSVTLASTAAAGSLESRVEESWRGAWVVVDAETRSNCDSRYTDTRVNGRKSQGKGRYWFEPGELAHVDYVNVHRSRVDVRLSIDAPLRLSWREGPFTLYKHVGCRVELEIEIPRSVIRKRDARQIDRYLAKVLEPHETYDGAQDSARWNQREAEPFPDDYDLTLAEYQIWKVERHNERVDAHLADAHEQLAGLSHAVNGGDDYVEGLAAGIAARRALRQRSCPQLVSGTFTPANPKGKRHRHNHHDGDEEPQRSEEWKRGYVDGQSLVHHLDVLTRAGGCYLPVPERPDRTAVRRENDHGGDAESSD